MKNELVPPEIKGKNVDLEESVTLDTTEEASLAFKRAYNRLLNPAIWHTLAGPSSAEFILTNDHAEEQHRLAKKGDHFKIDIPGPASAKGDGYDWVTVETIEQIDNPGKDEESCGMKLRASGKPGEEGESAAHFFKEDATSSFVIHRKGNKVTASYHGRNEVPNTDTGKTIDNIRNSMVAIGALAGLSELQWSSIIKGFLSNDVSDL
jgi:hypothetical protein